MKNAAFVLLWCGAALAVPAISTAQSDRGKERAGIALGFFVTDRATSTRLDSDDGAGTDIDLEDDLGLDSSTSVARFGGYYWFNQRHRVDLGYFDLSRDAERVIDKTIDFGDETFPINTVVYSESELSIVKVDYTYAVIDRDRGYLGLTGGLYVASSTMSLEQATLGRAESEGLTAPLPVFGLRGDYQIGDRWTLRGVAQWFQLSTDDVDGRFRDFYVGADYSFGERMAVGAAYNEVSMNLAATEDRGFTGSIDWGYDGILVYFKYDFGRRD
jgi:hypothetical protein